MINYAPPHTPDPPMTSTETNPDTTPTIIVTPPLDPHPQDATRPPAPTSDPPSSTQTPTVASDPQPTNNATPNANIQLHCSLRIATLQESNTNAAASSFLVHTPLPKPDIPLHSFLTQFAFIRDSHILIPVSIVPASPSSSIPEVLSAISNGEMETTLDDNDDPLWASALASPKREYWIKGAQDELKSLSDLQVFVLVPRSEVPHSQRPLKGKLVCKRKHDDSGTITRYKVRYIAKGFAQRYLIDYDKTAPTARLKSFRALLHIAAILNWDIQHIDIKTTFFHGILPESETVYMEQPPRFEEPGKEMWVMKLMKSIYGMKQASRIWNQTFHKTITLLGFKQLPCDWCIYH